MADQDIIASSDSGASGIKLAELGHEMRSSFLEYSMSVIVARALPDVRDGLKPVHRRILYAMYDSGITPNRPHSKSARTVGDVIGKYHPHGDSAVYDTMVRMAQDFSMRVPLVDGHGNFGSIDGDSAAAMRYTEARLAKPAMELLRDLEKETVDWNPNYDESLQEPSVLPARFPNLLVNGSNGIAVGMATNIPPHNLGETIDATCMMLDNPDCTTEELMTVLPGPDFPTGGVIMGKKGILDAYETGRGNLTIRSKHEIIEGKNGKHSIVITEIPYQVNRTNLMQKLGELIRDKKLPEISNVHDGADRNSPVDIIIELKQNAIPQVVLNKLYKHTQLQTSFGIIMLALVNGHPRILNLKQILNYYLEHQKDVITRRTRYELGKAKERAHILEGLKIALDHLDEVISTIRSSANADTAKAALMEKFSLSQRQAQAILDMRLQRLTGLERKKIDDEYIDVLETIDWLESVLADEHKVLGIIKEDLLEMKKKFGDARRTELSIDSSSMEIEDLIAEEDIVITISHQGYIKRQTLDNFRSQKRGGVGKTGGSGKQNDDCAEHLFLSTTHHNILFFTNKGRVYRQKGYEIPEAGRTARGVAIVNLLEIDADEKIMAVIPANEFREDQYLVMVTKQGLIKKTDMTSFANIRKSGLIALNLREEDDLISVMTTDGRDEIFVATRSGMGIKFSEEDVRPMGRTATGVKAITLKEDDYVVSAVKIDPEGQLLNVTENGYGKRTTTDKFNLQHRGGKGLKVHQLTEKTGQLTGVLMVGENDELMLITSEGVIIRLRGREISSYNRDSQGVKLMNLDDGVSVVGIAKISEEDIEEEAEETAAEAEKTEVE